jgi:hypothetical protein
MPNESCAELGPAQPYVSEELYRQKAELNQAKSQLDKYFLASKQDEKYKHNWLYFQNIVDTYRDLRFKVGKEFNAGIITNAWLKYYEIYEQYKFIPAKLDRKYIAFFNAELPGAALSAFNHYMKTMRKSVQFDWRASSLAPSPDTKNSAEALGDTYGLYEMNKDHWLMTILSQGDPMPEDYNSGDVTVAQNILDFERKVGPGSPLGGADLYSHDAGIDVSTTADGKLGFNDQELANAKIHFGCALSAFVTLRPGGVFIGKQYTFFETFTWNLLMIYSGLFDKFYICKPLTSRPYNSEVYLVGLGFHGLSPALRTMMFDRLTNFTTAPFFPMPDAQGRNTECIHCIESFSRLVFGQQAQIILQNVNLFDKYGYHLQELRTMLSKGKYAHIMRWLAKYRILSIKDHDKLAHRA